MSFPPPSSHSLSTPSLSFPLLRSHFLHFLSAHLISSPLPLLPSHLLLFLSFSFPFLSSSPHLPYFLSFTLNSFLPFLPSSFYHSPLLHSSPNLSSSPCPSLSLLFPHPLTSMLPQHTCESLHCPHHGHRAEGTSLLRQNRNMQPLLLFMPTFRSTTMPITVLYDSASNVHEMK